ncbi:MAG TPA: hypothetical protein DC038_12355 [Clostridiales bacterium]|nr:hypothetical protein [Clostridiales bacterium]
MIKKLANNNKHISTLLLLCFITAFLLSVAFIDTHASHVCTENICATCENLNFAAGVVRQMGMSARTDSIFSLICIVFLMYNVPFLYSLKKHITLISLKVRLDN